MRFRFVKNHILLDLPEGTFLLDTGCPYSFSFEIKNTISIEDVTHNINPNNYIGANREGIIKLLGEKVDGFIGMDTLTEYEGITINYPNNTITFAPEEGILCYKFDYKDGIVTQDFTLNGQRIDNVVFDTGACVSYVRRELISEKDDMNVFYEDSGFDGEVFAGKYNEAKPGSTLLDSNNYISNIGFMVGFNDRIFEKCNYMYNAFINPMYITLNGTTYLNNTISIDFKKKTICCVRG